MEMNGEKTIKKAKKSPQWIIVGYIICIIAIIGAIYLINYKKETEMPEAIDFTTNGAIGMSTEKYAYLDVQGLSYEVAIYGDTENENSSSNDRYYIAFNQGYMYIVDLDFDTIDQLKAWQDYTYSNDENKQEPEAVRIYGMTETIPEELKQMAVDFCNEGVPEEQQIPMEYFETYFGSVMLNVRREPVDTTSQELIIFIAIMALIILAIVHIVMLSEKIKVKKYLKKNEYEEELAQQLDDFVEEKHYKEKLIITRDFLVDLKYGGFAAFRFSDVKWVHIHNVKTYGVTASSSIIVYLRDGKTKLTCAEIAGKPNDEFIGILNKISEKAPADTLKGYTKETIKAFKEYKKKL